MTALASYFDARHHGGEWLLRIDDIDPLRDDIQAKESFEPMLRAHGLVPDAAVHFQSEHRDRYRVDLERLETFPCGCSRKDLSLNRGWHGPSCNTPAPQLARRWYCRASQTAEVLWRKEDWPSYHLACASDESFMEITHVVRGADLTFADPIHSEIIQAMGGTPPAYRSIPLVTNSQGQKLSKQNLAPALSMDAVQEQLTSALSHLFPERRFTGNIDTQLSTGVLCWGEHHED